MIKAPERKLKCYAVLWLFDDHALLRQTTCWSTSLFSARPCSWMRMWGCVVVCNLWGCITYQEFVFFKCRSYHLNWEIQTCCVTHVSHVRCRTSLCTATIVHRPVYALLPFRFQSPHEELMNSQTCINRWFPTDLFCILTRVKCNRKSMLKRFCVVCNSVSMWVCKCVGVCSYPTVWMWKTSPEGYPFALITLMKLVERDGQRAFL